MYVRCQWSHISNAASCTHLAQFHFYAFNQTPSVSHIKMPQRCIFQAGALPARLEYTRIPHNLKNFTYLPGRYIL